MNIAGHLLNASCTGHAGDGHDPADSRLLVNPPNVPAAAWSPAGTELTDLFGHSLPAPLLAASFTQLTYTNDPLAATVLAEARHAAAAGLLTMPGSLTGLFDLGPLNKLLRAAGQLAVPG